MQAGGEFGPWQTGHPSNGYVQWSDVCPLCVEPCKEGDDVRDIAEPGGLTLAHRECLLRSVVGGIGHLRNHAYWCVEVGDPDGSMTYRTSALLVDAWIAEHGID